METITYKLVKVLHIEGTESPFGCEHCGYGGLKNVFFLMGSDQKQITVGSECVWTLLTGQDLKQARDTDKNIKRAGREWKKQYPPPLENESRAAYINRRMAEIPNAAMASRAFRGINLYLKCKQRLEEQGILDPYTFRGFGYTKHYRDTEMGYATWNILTPHEGRTSECWLCRQQELLQQAYNAEIKHEEFRYYQEIAVKFGANLYDLAPSQYLNTLKCAS